MCLPVCAIRRGGTLIESKIDAKRIPVNSKKCDSQLQLETAFKSEGAASVGAGATKQFGVLSLATRGETRRSTCRVGGELPLIYVRALLEVGDCALYTYVRPAFHTAAASTDRFLKPEKVTA